ncbi:MAG TPA: hypothetical protein VFR12_03630 [Pyrinomonadaceae bacterium]|nr:hypothetical protein [Pyrinomonadaceae bacterium]
MFTLAVDGSSKSDRPTSSRWLSDCCPTPALYPTASALQRPVKAKYYPEDAGFLLEFEPTVEHYELYVAPDNNE